MLRWADESNRRAKSPASCFAEQTKALRLLWPLPNQSAMACAILPRRRYFRSALPDQEKSPLRFLLEHLIPIRSARRRWRRTSQWSSGRSGHGCSCHRSSTLRQQIAKIVDHLVRTDKFLSFVTVGNYVVILIDNDEAGNAGAAKFRCLAPLHRIPAHRRPRHRHFRHVILHFHRRPVVAQKHDFEVGVLRFHLVVELHQLGSEPMTQSTPARPAIERDILCLANRGVLYRLREFVF